MTNEIIKTNENGDILANIDTTTYEGLANVANAMNAANSLDKTFNDGDIFEIVAAMITNGTNPKTGAPCRNSYMIMRDGTALFTMSEGIANALERNLKLFGSFLANGLWFKLVEIPTNTGNTMKSLLVVAPQAK